MPQIRIRKPQGWPIAGAVPRSALRLGRSRSCARTAAARAGDDDNSSSVIDKIMEAIGLRDPNGNYEGINYNERSPLVVPPTRDLPPPAASTAPPAPNWPKDPDMLRRAKAKAKEKTVAPHPDYVAEFQPAAAARRARSGRCAAGQYADRQQCNARIR